ncbi:MAG TPA: zinc ribbon domain-containing protein [Clostridia bacterium]|jgi:hypothetical protein|nr:zinc ribbon domain-containing protein [Clostridia bacterium]
MNRFDTMLEAAEFAATLCAGWSFAYSDDRYRKKSLLGLAEIHDQENPADEDSFYVVSPAGAIGFSEDGETIDWLFLPLNCNEDLPLNFEPVPAKNFCRECGKPVSPGANFCGACGMKL